MKLLIVDDHHVVRQGLSFVLEQQESLTIIGQASNGLEAIQFIDTNQLPDLVLLDLSMPKMDGVETTAIIKRKNPDIKIVVLTSFDDQDHVISAIRAGADGYCLKDTSPEDLVATIHEVNNGIKKVDSKVATHLFQHVSKPADEETLAIKQLTIREKEVLIELSMGKSNKEIAETLFITEKTVKTHISNIFSKLPVQDRTQAALFAVKHGIAN
ncbi:response regulator transcription factor [Bacillus tamaricis]|uniref:Response regulator transcription factor n=1 Tax=Evansella tamaricis TaxID=2069301 RepID=A0ABS6JIF0_9BACI|nr:response regulator transcription factor [Evansella tamaricis]